MEQPFLPWVEGYAVGHEVLDAEHRRIAEAISEINAAQQTRQPPTRIVALLDAFLQMVMEHLRHENSAMREVSEAARAKGSHLSFLRAMSDAVIDEHIAEHARSLQKLNSIIGGFDSESDPEGPMLGDALRDWFVEHAVKYDAHLKAVFQAL